MERAGKLDLCPTSHNSRQPIKMTYKSHDKAGADLSVYVDGSGEFHKSSQPAQVAIVRFSDCIIVGVPCKEAGKSLTAPLRTVGKKMASGCYFQGNFFVAGGPAAHHKLILSRLH